MLKPAKLETLIPGNIEILDDIAEKSVSSQDGSVHGKLKTKDIKVQTMNPYSVLP
jgi:hypothetical protein